MFKRQSYCCLVFSTLVHNTGEVGTFYIRPILLMILLLLLVVVEKKMRSLCSESSREREDETRGQCQ